MIPSARLVLVVASCVIATAAFAHHRQTPEIVPLTTSGDTPLPRIAAPGNKTLVLAVEEGVGRKIVSISPWRNRKDPTLQTQIAGAGDHANPVVTVGGRAFAFDTTADLLELDRPGRQVFRSSKGSFFPASDDPSGTSVNPSLDSRGTRVTFESTGDLAGTGNAGARQIFLREINGAIRQLSGGLGSSRNSVLSPRKRAVVFESTTHPTTGIDTGIAQIWLGDVATLAFAPITAGQGPSMNPAFSNDGRLVAFESTADLAADVPVDTGVAQIYVYDTQSKTYARITNDALGCAGPSVLKAQRDWRIAFVCNGQPYYFMLRAGQRYLVPTGGGTTQRVAAALGIHFLVISTTADLVNGGVTPGNQVYLVNLFKRPAQPVSGEATWFPRQGMPPL